MPKAQKPNRSQTVSRDAKSGRFVDIGGTAVRVATPVTSLPTKKQAEIRTAVRDFYAGKKGK
jgi:translation elongation factor P/translation initiation factor 5A